jgi:hypothetical protein
MTATLCISTLQVRGTIPLLGGSLHVAQPQPSKPEVQPEPELPALPCLPQLLDSNLVIKDRLNSTVWMAPINCPAGTLLKPWAQCGGTSLPPATAVSVASATSSYAARDGQYQGTCCPAGWTCYRRDRSKWLCQPSAALESCTGPKKIPAGQACGGTAACGADAMCMAASAGCCAPGSVCQRQSSQRWTCTALPAAP